ncbi:MAG: 30S ribosomal protein S2, partial [Nitratireductor sp.]|nr:30S ribosomal protein S2 [Nitratireductor sp.]
KDMGGTPDLLFIVDTNKESIAVTEARRLKIPVVAILDTNCDPDMIDHPIPGNDDASRAIALYCELIAKAAVDGIARQQGMRGVDLGASSEGMAEPALEETAAADEEAAPVALFATPEGAADDLKKISGVGPVLEEKLNALGITKFAQIAAFSEEEVAKVDEVLNFKGRIAREDWISQARELAAQA